MLLNWIISVSLHHAKCDTSCPEHCVPKDKQQIRVVVNIDASTLTNDMVLDINFHPEKNFHHECTVNGLRMYTNQIGGQSPSMNDHHSGDQSHHTEGQNHHDAISSQEQHNAGSMEQQDQTSHHNEAQDHHDELSSRQEHHAGSMQSEEQNHLANSTLENHDAELASLRGQIAQTDRELEMRSQQLEQTKIKEIEVGQPSEPHIEQVAPDVHAPNISIPEHDLRVGEGSVKVNDPTYPKVKSSPELTLNIPSIDSIDKKSSGSKMFRPRLGQPTSQEFSLMQKMQQRSEKMKERTIKSGDQTTIPAQDRKDQEPTESGHQSSGDTNEQQNIKVAQEQVQSQETHEQANQGISQPAADHDTAGQTNVQGGAQQANNQQAAANQQDKKELENAQSTIEQAKAANGQESIGQHVQAADHVTAHQQVNSSNSSTTNSEQVSSLIQSTQTVIEQVNQQRSTEQGTSLSQEAQSDLQNKVDELIKLSSSIGDLTKADRTMINDLVKAIERAKAKYGLHTTDNATGDQDGEGDNINQAYKTSEQVSASLTEAEQAQSDQANSAENQQGSSSGSDEALKATDAAFDQGTAAQIGQSAVHKTEQEHATADRHQAASNQQSAVSQQGTNGQVNHDQASHQVSSQQDAAQQDIAGKVNEQAGASQAGHEQQSEQANQVSNQQDAAVTMEQAHAGKSTQSGSRQAEQASIGFPILNVVWSYKTNKIFSYLDI